MSRSHASKTKTIPVTSKLAVMSYLDEMLHEATTAAEEEIEQNVVDTPAVDAVPDAVEPVVETEIETETETETETEVLSAPATELVTEEDQAAVEIIAMAPVVEVAETQVEEAYIAPVIEEPITTTVESSEVIADTSEEVVEQTETDTKTDEGPPIWMDNGRPSWAQERFDCLVFSVNGLKLAVPLLLLGNIHPLEKELTPLFDQPPWFLGLLPVQQDRNIRVIDTAQLVMPERYAPEQAEPLKYAVGVHSSDWAFGAQSIEGSITLEPDAVKWRSQRTSRPWLAGTVISEMCALIDLDAFNRILVA